MDLDKPALFKLTSVLSPEKKKSPGRQFSNFQENVQRRGASKCTLEAEADEDRLPRLYINTLDVSSPKTNSAITFVSPRKHWSPV
jgi:hypothetical protein